MDRELKLISGLNRRTAEKISAKFGPGKAFLVAEKIQGHITANGELSTPAELEDVVGQKDAGVLLGWAQEVIDERDQKKLMGRFLKWQKKGQMKGRYLWTHILVYYFYVPKSKPGEPVKEGWWRWRFDPEMRGMGLAQAVTQHTEGRLDIQPVAIPLLHSTKEWEEEFSDDPDEKPAVDFPLEEIKKLWGLGIAVSQGRIGWNMNSSFYQLKRKTFPNAVDATAYGHGLNAPTVPGGIMLDVEVTLTTIRAFGGKSMGSDGSGRFHPDHPLAKQLARPGKKMYPVQVRFINEQGVFCKGILVPDERCLDQDGNPAIMFDWVQVKGRWKENAALQIEKGGTATIRGHIGVIQVWDKPGRIRSSFELLENIQNTPENQRIIEQKVDQYFEVLAEEGLDGLAQKSAEDNRNLSLGLKLITVRNSVEAEKPESERKPILSPLALPMMQAVIEDRLQRGLWHVAQGAGITCERYIACIDDSLKPGTVVLAGFHPGQTIGCFRYPIVLSQVLTTTNVVRPLPWHLIGTGAWEDAQFVQLHARMVATSKAGDQILADALGEQLIAMFWEGVDQALYQRGYITPNVIYMSTHDLKTRLIGDDDGDPIAVTGDQDVVRLFRSPVNSKIFSIEHGGKKRPIETGSPEGLAHMAVDQRGPVGALTVARSALLSIGDIAGADATSLLIQEAVDKPKHAVPCSEWKKATDPKYWVEQGGVQHFLEEGVGNDGALTHYRPAKLQTDVPMPEFQAWKNERLTRLGGVQQKGPGRQSATGWRNVPGAKKKIPSKAWIQTSEAAGGWGGGNLVHHAWNYGLKEWRKIEGQFDLQQTPIDLSMLLEELLQAKGCPVTHQQMSWETYQMGLRKRSGVVELGKKFWKGMEQDSSERRFEIIDRAVENFHAGLRDTPIQDLVQIWYMECSHARTTDQELKGNINYAYYSIVWEESPILKILGIEFPSKCEWVSMTIERQTTEECLKGDEPFQTLNSLILTNEDHGKKIVDPETGLGIPLWECRDCCDALQRNLVQRIRFDRGRSEHSFCKALNSALNGTNGLN